MTALNAINCYWFYLLLYCQTNSRVRTFSCLSLHPILLASISLQKWT